MRSAASFGNTLAEPAIGALSVAAEANALGPVAGELMGVTGVIQATPHSTEHHTNSAKAATETKTPRGFFTVVQPAR